jgi:hypothetical protein
MNKYISLLLIIAFSFSISACGKHIAQQKQKPQEQQQVLYLCPMHTEYISSSPGKCPKCGMQLITFEAYRNSKAGVITPNRMPDNSHTGAPGGGSGGHSGHH